NKCNHECGLKCPVNLGFSKRKCVEIEDVAIISESLCIGCGICVDVCPFKAITIVNIRNDLEKDLIFSYGKNSFRLFKLPNPKIGQIIGFIGQNGIGKTTLINILSGNIKPNFGILNNTLN